MERELTLANVYHPSFIDNWSLVDHPTVRPIQRGAPDLGWEGDNRLAVYLEPATKTFVLWRLEHDNVYRPVARMQPGEEITPASVNSLIRNLVRIDARRGFDPGADVETAEAARDKAEAAHHAERVAAAADKLHYGIGQSHMAGVD